MKLVTKVSLVAGILFMLATQLVSVVLLFDMWKDNLAIVQEAEQQKFETALENFVSRSRNSQAANYGDLTKMTLLRQVFRSTTIPNMALYQGETELYNQSRYEFKLRKEGAQGLHVERQNVGERNLLVYTKDAVINKENYQVYFYRDITYLLDQIKDSAVKFFGVSFGMTALLMVVLILLERQILKPIYYLRDGAREIGKGNYEKRIPINRRDEVGEIAESFNEMAEQVQNHMQVLENSNEMQKQMLGSLGHELRTPMTSIIGYADTLLRVKLTEKQKEKALFYIRHECGRLSRLSQKLLELNSLNKESSIEKDTPLSMGFFKRIEESVRYSLEKEEKYLELRIIKEPAPVLIDADLMESLVLNLIDNARKASGPGSKITLQIDKNRFDVIDEGRGIPKEEIEKVTKAFYMVDKARSKQQGSVGLGLALCQQIAVLHQAELKIESSEGIGTDISVTFRA